MDRLGEDRAVSLLMSCDAKIKQLELDLEYQRAYKVSIEKRIIQFRSMQAPITRLPKELLVRAFEWVKFKDPLKIGIILFVCRHWNETARNSPALWGEFTLKVKPDTAAIARQTRFVEAALRYSRVARLDVTLHLPRVEDLWSHLARKMLEISQSHHQKDHEAHDNIVGWLHNAFMNEDEPLVFYCRTETAIVNQINTIVGPGGLGLSRLRSLTLTFHSTDFSDWADKKLFHYETPVLEQLVVMTDDEERSLPSIFKYPAPQLTRVASNFNLMVDRLVTKEGQLTHLGVVLDESTFGLFPTTRLTYNLTHLYIHVPSTESGWTIQPQSRPGDFSFPILRDAAIEGLCPPELIIAPNLSCLRLLDEEACGQFLGSSTRFPKLSKLHLWAGGLNIRESVVPYVIQLAELTELAFLYPLETRLRECIDELRCDLLAGLVVEGLNLSRGMFLRGFEVYETTPIIRHEF